MVSCVNSVLNSCNKSGIDSAALKMIPETPNDTRVLYWIEKISIYKPRPIVEKLELFTFSKLDCMMKNRFLGMKNGFLDPPRPSPTPENPRKPLTSAENHTKTCKTSRGWFLLTFPAFGFF